jgi:NADPH-dependent glutamate synthase beta subunit-like oxidoreductase
MPLNVAIVGSGPSGFYTVAALLKLAPDCQIDIIERLPTPFGLIRGGVAPDHQKTKNVWRAYDKSAQQQAVRFFGNVEVGRDVTIDELRQMYDAVVLAVGSPRDRNLGIPGDDKKGVFGAASFVGWYNGHPDFRNLDPNIDIKAAVVVGNGNVAIDCARVLAKTPAEMASTDLTDYAAKAIHGSPLTDIYLCGRRGPGDAKFTNVELREMGELADCAPILDAKQLTDGVPDDLDDRDRRLRERNLETLREFTTMVPGSRKKRMHFLFYTNPVEVLGGDTVEAIRMERTMVKNGRAVGTGEFFEVPCGLVIAAIGYDGDPFPGLPYDEKRGVVVHDNGRIGDGLYAVGWIKRGPTGVIGTNKHDGDLAAEQILEDARQGSKAGRARLETHLKDKGVRWVSYADWKKIDGAEIANAPSGAPRRKFSIVEEMLALLR